MRDPWHRDNEDYTVLNTLLLVLCVVLVLVGGLGLKLERRSNAIKLISYGCTVEQADQTTGECK